ncbi:phage tail fiber protein [Atlantibacter subterraneus]|uniref:phage tail fiber protein n=1 Tax=Atlantibacter subterraneus TaxID=255519 RepID=UPI00289A300B|nr:phage tail protein [Atlantibacter subterranea]
MIYSAGTIAIAGAGVTGTGTNFMSAASHVRAGQTLLVLTSPPQIFEIATVNSATSLTLTAAANPWLAAGTKYAILTTDALSVDGLAQSIAQLVKDYDASSDAWEAFAGTSANQTVTVTINGVSVVIPSIGKLAQRGSSGAVPVEQGGTGGTTPAAARAGLQLGSVATRDGGTAAGNVPVLGNANIAGSQLLRLSSSNTPGIAYTSNYTSANAAAFNIGNNAINGASAVIAYERGGQFGCLVGLDYDNKFKIGGWSMGAVAYEFYTQGNTVVDGNGYLKKASPVVKVAGDGSAELNAESAGVDVQRIRTGVYRISGVLGFNSDPAWGGIDGGIEIPLDRNKQPLLWVDYEIEAEGSILLKTYHRTHPTAPRFARNEIDGVSDGDPIDIPVGRCVDLRVEMPVNSLWNVEQARRAEEMRAEYERQQREAEQRNQPGDSAS